MQARWLCALLCLALTACNPADKASTAGSPLQDAQGRWVLINYWADWCKPCAEEMPELNAFQKQYADRVKLVAVNYDGLRGAALQEQARHLQIAFTVLEDDPAAQLGYRRPEVLPSTYVFGPDGKFRQVLQGEQTRDSLAAAIGAGGAAQ